MLFLLPLPDLVEQNGAVLSWPPLMLDQHPCLLHYYYSFGNRGMALLAHAGRVGHLSGSNWIMKKNGDFVEAFYFIGVPDLTQFAPLLPENYSQLSRLQTFIDRFTRPA
jgi:hypothetical protein